MSLLSHKFILVFSTIAVTSAVQCGDLITSDTVLNSDRNCDCSTLDIGSALAVVGPAKLDLNGHTVSCTDMQSFCISILGQGATIQNGKVMNCSGGVGNFGGFGNTLIKNITATSTDVAFYLSQSDNNRLIDVVAQDNNFAGILVYGNNNLVKNSYSARQLYEGISFAGSNNKAISKTIEDSLEYTCMGVSPIDDLGFRIGVGNVFQGNTVRRCYGYGVYLFASNSKVVDNQFYNTGATSISTQFNNNKITGNFVSGSSEDGIGVFASENTHVANNLIVDAVLDGIDLQPTSSACSVKDNTVTRCGKEGIQVRGDEHIIARNKVSDCLTGIDVIFSADKNRLINNHASGSTLFDLSDASANCGSNVWKGNEGKGNIPCTTS